MKSSTCDCASQVARPLSAAIKEYLVLQSQQLPVSACAADTLDALNMLIERAKRLHAALEAWYAVSDKAYPAKYVAPWRK